MNKLLLTTTILAGLVQGSALGAQATAQGPNDQSVETAQLEDIVVTAQRRTETLQNAGIAASAVAGEAIRNLNVTTAQDLTRLVPAIQIGNSTGPAPQFYLRGIGNFTGNPFSDAAVAFNYDGVFISRPSAANGFFYDLDRVEVLKGPQGTLYGRNATGGVLNILPKAPVLSKLNGEASVGVGNYGLVQATGAANVPLGDTAAIRVAASTNNHDGYMSDGTSDDKSYGIRGQFYWEASSTFNVKLAADYFHQGGRGTGTTLLTTAGNFQFGDPWQGTSDPKSCATFDTLYFAVLPGLQCPPNDSRTNNRYWGIHAVANLDLGIGTLTFLPAHRAAELDFVNNSGPIIRQRDHGKQDSLELRFASDPDKAFSFVAGAYYLHETTKTPLFQADLISLSSSQRIDLDTESWAAFGQARLSLSDHFRIIGGIRYTKDSKSFDGFQTFASPVGALVSPNLTLTDSRSWDAVTGKVGIEANLAKDSLLYASAERGFKAGGFFFFPTALGRPAFDPEYINAYTVGIKNRFMDRRLQLNLEAFWYDYKDQQISTRRIVPGFGQFFPTLNVGNSRIRGVEIDTQFLVTNTTRLSANIQYVDSKYTSFVYTVPIAMPASGCAVTPIAGTIPPSFTVNCTGKRLVNSPEWTINLGVNQAVPLSNGGSIVGDIRARYQSAMVGALEYLPGHTINSYWQADLSLTYNAPDKRFSISAWANNLFNEAIISTPFGVGTVAAPPTFAAQPPYASLRPPRTFGLRVTVPLGD